MPDPREPIIFLPNKIKERIAQCVQCDIISVMDEAEIRGHFAWLYDDDDYDDVEKAWHEVGDPNGRIIPPAPPRKKTTGSVGLLYILHLSVANGEYKVGITTGDLSQRLIAYRTHLPPSIAIVVDCCVHTTNARGLEKEVFDRLESSSIRGEWFMLSRNQLQELKAWLKTHKGTREFLNNPIFD